MNLYELNKNVIGQLDPLTSNEITLKMSLIDEYYKIASEMGCKYFVTTDHLEFMSVYNNQDWTVDFKSLEEDLKRLSKKYPNVIPLKGVEMGYRKDHLDRMMNIIQTEDFDLINLSIHDNGEIDYYLKEEFINKGVDKVLKIYFDNMIDGLVTMDDFDVLSHFDYGFKTALLVKPNIKISEYEDYLVKIFKILISKKKALEINIKVQTTINSLEHIKYFLTLYKQLGGERLTISTDSHEPNLYMKNYDKYASIVKECGFNELCYYVKRKEYRYSI